MRWLRNIFGLIAILSGLLSTVSIFAWIDISGPYYKPLSKIEISSVYGRFSVDIGHGYPPRAARDSWGISLVSTSNERDGRILHGTQIIYKPVMFSQRFSYWKKSSKLSGGWTINTMGFSTPYWLLVLISSPWPGIALVLYVMRRKHTPGICRNCGYDLRGTPSGVCPECGRTATPLHDDEPTPTKPQT